MPNYHVTVHSADPKEMADLGRAHHVPVYRLTLVDEDTGCRISALADEQTITRLQSAGYRVEQHEDVHQVVQDILRHRGQDNPSPRPGNKVT